MKKFILTVCIYCLVSVQVIAQQLSPPLLGERELLDIVQRYHPVAKKARLSVEQAGAAILSARGGFDPVAGISLSEKTFSGTTYYHHLQPELRVPLWYGIDIVTGIEQLDGERINPESTIGKASYAGIVIPLAKNRLFDKRRAALKTAKIFHSLSLADQRSQLNDLLLQATKAYWHWAAWHAQYQVIAEAVLLNEKRLHLIRQAVLQGDRPALDTIEAETQLQAFRLQQTGALQELENARLELSVYCWNDHGDPYELPETVEPDLNLLRQQPAMQAIPSLDSLLTLLPVTHPALQQYTFKLQALAVERKMKFQELLPSLDFKYFQLGKGYNLLQAKSGPLFSNNYRYGVSFSMPLRLSRGRAEYRTARLKIQEAKLELDLKMLTLQNKVKAGYNTALALLSQAAILEKACDNYLRLQKGEELKFLNGESSLFLVNSREAKTLEAQQKKIKTTADFFAARTSLFWATGTLPGDF